VRGLRSAVSGAPRHQQPADRSNENDHVRVSSQSQSATLPSACRPSRRSMDRDLREAPHPFRC
jgi:hypothetical protein